MLKLRDGYGIAGARATGAGYLDTFLSKGDLIDIMELIQKSTSCLREDEFLVLVEDLRSLVPFDYAISGLAKSDKGRKILSYDVVNVNYPGEWLALYLMKEFHHIDPVVKENFSRFGLQRWTDTYKRHDVPNCFLYEAGGFGLEDGYTYGVRNLREGNGSLFSLSGRSIEYNARTEIILDLAVPHLHQALTSVLSRSSLRHGKTDPTVSSREREVLNWLKHGKSSWDIAMILSISERTVNFHIYNLMQKLGAVNRIQVVAIAIHLGLVDIE